MVTRQTYNREKGGYDVHGYSKHVGKILLCGHCGTLDLRTKQASRYLRVAMRVYPYWSRKFHLPSVHLTKKSFRDSQNIREAEAFDEKKKAAREDSAGNGGQESISAKVRKPLGPDNLPVLRVQRVGRK
jgi:hypothetical protein